MDHKDRPVGSEADDAVRAVDAEGAERFLKQPERCSIRSLSDLGVLQRCNNVLVIIKRVTKGPVRIMQDMREYLGIGIIAHIPRIAAAHEELADRHKGRVLAVSHGCVTLDEERMARVKVD